MIFNHFFITFLTYFWSFLCVQSGSKVGDFGFRGVKHGVKKEVNFGVKKCQHLANSGFTVFSRIFGVLI